MKPMNEFSSGRGYVTVCCQKHSVYLPVALYKASLPDTCTVYADEKTGMVHIDINGEGETQFVKHTGSTPRYVNVLPLFKHFGIPYGRGKLAYRSPAVFENGIFKFNILEDMDVQENA